MKRRTFLGTIGIGLTMTAGCIESAGDGGGTGSAGSASPATGTTSSDDGTTADRSTWTDTASETVTETATEQQPNETPIASDETYERRVGSGTLDEAGLRRPHRVAVRNPTTTTRTVALTVRRGGEDVFAERFALDSEAVVGVVLTDLADYEVQTTLPESGATETVTIGPASFTCNVTQTRVAVEPAGTLSSASVSTMMACPGVETMSIGADATVTTAVGGGESAVSSDEVRVENPTASRRTVRILVRHDDQVVFDGCYTLDAGATARVTLDQRESYQIETTLLGTAATATATLDCNSSSTRFVVEQDGTLTVSGMSTKMACPTTTETESP